MSSNQSHVRRRNFIRDSGLLIAGGAIGSSADGSDRNSEVEPKHSQLNVAFIGCGKRARELASTLLNPATKEVGNPSPEIQIVGLADLFGSQSQSFYRSLKGRYASSITDDCSRMSGISCVDRLLDRGDIDLAFVTTPPICRPEYGEQLLSSGVHLYLEKPLAADKAGVERLVSAAQPQADKLTIHVGFQRRYDLSYRKLIDRIHSGAIGTPLFGRTFCNVGSIRELTPDEADSEIEHQLRNWKHFRWTGGDFLVEQHVAGLDIIRWALGEEPIAAHGEGGWTQAASHSAVDVFDHHSVDFEFASGFVCSSRCRRRSKAWNQTNEQIYGTEGRVDFSAGQLLDLNGNVIESFGAPNLKAATQRQLLDLVDSICSGRGANQVAEAAKSCNMALAAQEATSSGKKFKFV
ncbi:MAG: Gfo/Idh/MocA family oxidoreductase [Planctomycetota bacterium]